MREGNSFFAAQHLGSNKKKEEVIMAKHKCKYYLRNDEGVRACSVCDKPAPGQPPIEDKMQGKHEDKSGKAPLYISDKDKANQEA